MAGLRRLSARRGFSRPEPLCLATAMSSTSYAWCGQAVAGIAVPTTAARADEPRNGHTTAARYFLATALLGYFKRLKLGGALRRYPVLDRAVTDQIAKARQAAGFSQRELSSKLGRRNNYIQNIESGGQSVSASELHAIACECNTTGQNC